MRAKGKEKHSVGENADSFIVITSTKKHPLCTSSGEHFIFSISTDEINQMCVSRESALSLVSFQGDFTDAQQP